MKEGYLNLDDSRGDRIDNSPTYSYNILYLLRTTEIHTRSVETAEVHKQL